MGTQCFHVTHSGSPEPVSLGPSHKGDVCDKCREAVYMPGGEPEEFMDLFRAARVLFEEGITDEDIIIPTLVFAAQSGKRPLLAYVRNQFADVAGVSGAWKELEDHFINSFDTLGPISIREGVLLLRARPLTVLAYGPEHPGGLVEHITIDIYARSLRAIDAKDVERHYTWALDRFSIPQSPYGLGLDELWYPDRVRIVVRPPHPRIDAPVANLVTNCSNEQQYEFPPSSRVRDHYASAVRYARENALTNILGRKRPGSPNEAYNLIPACVAWYVGGCEANPSQPNPSAEARKLVEEYFASLPDPPPIKTRSNLRRNVTRISLPVRRIDEELVNETNCANLTSSFGLTSEGGATPV